MWIMTLPWHEFIFRGILVYLFLIIVLRLTGKRQIGQLAPVDLILLLVLSNAVQNAMNGGDNSITGGVISALTLVGLHYLVAYLSFKFNWIERLIEGSPAVIITDGVIDQRVMDKQFLTQKEIDAALRANGIEEVSEVHHAVLENNGQISVTLKK